MNSFIAAFTISIIACGLSMAVVLYFIKHKPELLYVGIMASTAIRLMLMIAGTIVVILTAKVDVIAFLIWISIFYLAMLIWEIRLAFQRINKITFKGDKV